MDEFYDWGKNKIDPAHPDTDWINDLEIYPKTPVYRNQYFHFKAETIKRDLPITKYLSIGTGLGRHVVLAKETFHQLEKIITVDNDISPHKSVQAMSEHVGHLFAPVVNALDTLKSAKKTFDFVCFENIGHNHGVNTEKSIKTLVDLLSPQAFLAIIGDTKFDTRMLQSTGKLIHIPNETQDWGETTKLNLWYKGK